MPTEDHMRSAIATYAQSFTSRQLDTLMALFTEDAVQADPANSPANVGHEAIRTFFENSYAATSASSWESSALYVCGDHVAVDFEVNVTMEGGSARIDGIEVFTFADDGRIRSVTAYWGEQDMTFSPA